MRGILVVLSEIVFATLFWSLLCTLSAQIWFFPLEYMDITGYEALIFLLFAPFLLRWDAIRSKAQSPLVFAVAGLALAAAWRQQSLVIRTFILAPATGLCAMGIAATFQETSFALPWGAVVVMLDRLANWSRSSMWSSDFGNSAFVAIVVGAAGLKFLLSPQQQKPQAQRAANEPSHTFITSVSLGSLLFLFHWFVVQASVLPRWLDIPVLPASLVVAVAAIAGLAFPPPASFMLLGAVPVFFAIWMIHVPSSLLAIFAFVFCICSLWEPLSGRISLSSFAWALVVWFVHLLGSVWTVAYNFVPVGGTITREQTHVHLYVMAAAAGATLFFLGASTKVKDFNGRRAFWLAIVALLVLGPIGFVRLQHASAIPVRAQEQAARDDGHIRSMIWAVHFGYNNHGQNSFEAIEAVIRSNGANVIGLLESDLARPFNDNWDVVDWLSERLGMNADYGPSTLNNTWGCALLTVYPIVRSHRILLPSPEGELACLIDATLDIKGTHVHVLVTHFGNWRDRIDRDLQTQEVADMLKRAKPSVPHIYLGYLTNKPYSEHYNTLVSAGWIDSAPAVMNRWCQYIFYRGLKLEKFWRFDTGDISDTEAQLANFRILN